MNPADLRDRWRAELSTLLAYDLTILWKSARAAFSRRRDFALLVFAIPTLLLMAFESAVNTAVVIREMAYPGRMLIVVATGFFIELSVSRRLTHLEVESIVTRYALRLGPRLVYRLFWYAIPLAASISIMAASSESGAPLVAWAVVLTLSFGTGAGLGGLARELRRRFRCWLAKRRLTSGSLRTRRLTGIRRRQRITNLVAARTGLVGPSVARNAALFGGIGAFTAFGYRLTLSLFPRPLPELFAGLTAVLVFLLLLRQHAQLLQYLLYLGIEPVGPALVPVTAACSFAVALILGALASNIADRLFFVAAGAVSVLLFVVLALFRGLHFATRARQSADFAFQIDFILVLLAGFFAVPLAPVVLVGRLLMLLRRARKMRYMVP